MIDRSRVNKERVQKLVDVLRSGDYKKGFYSLKKNDCYSLNGVACNVSNVSQWVEHENYATYDQESVYLPDSVLNYYGFDKHDFGTFLIMYQNEVETGFSLSDRHTVQLSFLQLADLIEETYLK